jgi:hypothetical protein
MRQSGFYSILQFCPDAERAERLNAGVVLAFPAHSFLKTEIAEDLSHLKQLLHGSGESLLRRELESLKARLSTEGQHLATREALQQFAATRTGVMRLTEPRSIAIDAPDQTLHDLFVRLVNVKSVGSSQKPKGFRAHVDEVLISENILPLIKKPQTVLLDDLPVPIRVPFSFQNGRLHLIQPLDLARGLKAISETALAGQYIEKANASLPFPRQMVALTPDLQDANAKKGAEILTDHAVRVVPLTQFASFIENLSHRQWDITTDD